MKFAWKLIMVMLGILAALGVVIYHFVYLPGLESLEREIKKRFKNDIVNVMDAMGKEVILIETVGVGQEEVDVVRVADTVVLVMVPGLGDDIQAIKAGVLEIADVLVVNKADRPGADDAARDLAQMLTLGTPRGGWKLNADAGIAVLVRSRSNVMRRTAPVASLISTRRTRASWRSTQMRTRR